MKEKVYKTEIASRKELVAKINMAAMEIHQYGLDNVQRSYTNSLHCISLIVSRDSLRRMDGNFIEHIIQQSIDYPNTDQQKHRVIYLKLSTEDISKLVFLSCRTFELDDRFRIAVLTCYGTKIVLQWFKEGKLVINKISQLGPMDPSTDSRCGPPDILGVVCE
ncbi:hypothetical protein ANN_06914 [Periplaneta americana]|uniref:Uncharacterized protein n=1 Tax=Periplaneta americana TaxID=6978 RepID=A0ABQ8TGZ0_PERAM|nr:hypothetical protein ANN_06914 [Periplaneta americana]